jgi:hypothetical protein
MNNIDGLKDKAILLAWIAGLLILICVLWILTQPVQAKYLLRTVNSVFITAGDSRRVASHISRSGGKAGLLGYWYSMYNSADQMFVFTFFQDGIFVPLGAVVSSDGSVNDIIPLSAHAVKVFDNLPQNILQMYVTRIESAALAYIEGKSE